MAAHAKDRYADQWVVTDKLERPCFAVYDQDTRVDGKPFRAGTWFHGAKYSGPDEKVIPFDHRICDALHVVAETLTDGEGAGLLLNFEVRGRAVEWAIPKELLGGKGDEVIRGLMRRGLAIEYAQRRHIPAYLCSRQRPERIISVVTKTGWHETGVFVLPSRVIGGGDIRYQSTGKAVSLFTCKGTSQSWQEEVGRYCLGNPVLILSVCAALAGPLLARVEVNGGGVHLVGDSSSGKSLAQLIAASVWGNPSAFASSWDISKGGLEIEAAARNDTVLILDEIKRADPKRVEEMAYTIGNGTGRTTMTRERESRPRIEWRLLALSSGERSLSDHAAISGNSAHAGAELRLVDVNAGTRRFRAFDEVYGMTGQQFHHQLTHAVKQHYGHLGPLFVESLFADEHPEALLEHFQQMSAAFAVGSAQAGRVADRFAVMALAGEQAIARKLLDWPVGTAQNACRQLFGEWTASMGDGNLEDRQILRGITDFIEQYGDSRFSDIHSEHGHSAVRDRAGFYEVCDERRLYLFNSKALTAAALGFNVDRIVRALAGVEALAKMDVESQQKRFTKSYRLPGGGKGRFYVIDPEKVAP